MMEASINKNLNRIATALERLVQIGECTDAEPPDDFTVDLAAYRDALTDDNDNDDRDDDKGNAR